MGNSLSLGEPQVTPPSPVEEQEPERHPIFSFADAIFPPNTFASADTNKARSVTPTKDHPPQNATRTDLTMITAQDDSPDVPIITGQLLMTGALAAAESIMDASVGVSRMLWTVAADVSQVPMSFINKISRPQLHERWASLSDFRVGCQPHLVLRIARHLGPTEVRRVRAVSRFWYDTLDDMVKATEIWVAVLNDDALEKIARHSALSEQDKDVVDPLAELLVPYGLVGYYSTEPGRYVARFKTMDLGRRVPRFDQDGFRGIRVAVPYGRHPHRHSHGKSIKVAKRRSSLLLLSDATKEPDHETKRSSSVGKRTSLQLERSSSRHSLDSQGSGRNSLARPSLEKIRPSLDGIKESKSPATDIPSEANTILSSPTEDSSITIPSVNDTPTLINGPLPTFFESKHQSYIIHDLTTADPTDSWFERRPYHAFDFRHGHHQAEVYRNVGNVFVHNHFLLQLDELNHSISEINLPLSDSTMSQVWLRWRHAATRTPQRPSPPTSPSFPVPPTLSYPLYSPSRLSLILHHITPQLEPRFHPHLHPTPSLSLRHTLSCASRFLPESFYPIFCSLAGGEEALIDFLRIWQQVDKRVEILIAFDANAAKALIASKEASAASANAFLQWIQAPIKEVAASIVIGDEDEEKVETAHEGRNRSKKVRAYCREAANAFVDTPGGELYLRMTGFAGEVKDEMAVYAHISENILSILVRETGFEGYRFFA